MHYVYDHDLHIHSRISLCSGDPEETNERILQYARDNRLSTICLTDHFWDETIPLSADSAFYKAQDLAHVRAALPLPKAAFWLQKLNALLALDLPFHKIGIAHLTCGLIDRNRQAFLDTIAAIDRDGMYKAFRNAAKCGVGIELNADDMKCTDAEAEIVLRPYRIAQEVGCKFYMGSDAHHPKALEDAKAIFERAIDRLGLTEDEKFILA